VPRQRREKKSVDRPSAYLDLNGKHYFLGRWNTEHAAKLARDRACLYFGAEDRVRLVAQAKALGPLSPEELKQLARLAQKRERQTTSLFDGVSWDTRRAQWHAGVRREGRPVTIGFFEDEVEAAEMVDRVSRHLGLTRLNFPDRALSPISVEAVKEEHKRARKEKASSSYIGVILTNPELKKPWFAKIAVSGNHLNIGRFATEREAAIARDRAALHYLDDPALNFPKQARAQGPADLETLRAEIRHELRATRATPYVGVVPIREGRFGAHIEANGKRVSLGGYPTVEAAAVAVDRAILFLGSETPRNFPDRELTPAAPEALRRKARASWKKEKSVSRYRGVVRYRDGWRANIVAGRGLTLGTFDDEEEAALAYDRAALAVHGPSATLNFPDRGTQPSMPKKLADESWGRFKETTTSRYTGVFWHASHGQWSSKIQVDHVVHNLGRYDDEAEAARAYDRAARRLRGPGGRLNFE
jgi:hypothetical protein